MRTMKRLWMILVSLFIICLPATGQVAFSVKVAGQGKPVLLFPGFGCPGDLWDRTVDELSGMYECHVFTFAGFGNVPAIGFPWLPRIKDQIITYVMDYKLDRPSLLGHSLGGTLSLWLALSEPDMFDKVVAVDALPCTAAVIIPSYKKGESFPYDSPQSRSMLGMSRGEFKALLSRSLPYMCLSKDKQEVILKWLCQCDRQTYVYGYVDFLNLDLQDSVSSIRIPVTILAATYPDKDRVRETYAWQYRKLPGVRVLYADSAAHFIMFDQFGWFIENVKKYIE